MSEKDNADSADEEEQVDDSARSIRSEVAPRRTVLATLLGLGGLGLTGTSPRASAAQQKARPWNQDVDAHEHDLFNLGSLAMAASGTEIADFEGDGLSVDRDGILNASFDLSAVDPGGIDDFVGRYLGFNLSDRTLQFAGPAEWGNAGSFTNTATDTGAAVSGGAYNEATGDLANIGGGSRNEASDNFATVGGGHQNTVNSPNTTVGGGRLNTASGFDATVGGGNENTATGVASTVGGGELNTATETDSTIAGGRLNVVGECSAVGGGESNGAGGPHATVSGGFLNTAGGEGASIPGGRGNTADGEYSFTVGRKANTNGHDGALVFGDSSDTEITADAADEAFFQMPVNATSFSNTSSRAQKTAVDPVDTEAALDSVNDLDITTWEYTDTDNGRHMGPMAEAFHDDFKLGESAERINTVDADGVAMAAIQGLSEKLDEAGDVIDDQAERIEDLEGEVSAKDDRIETLEAGHERLRERLEVIEERLEGNPSDS